MLTSKNNKDMNRMTINSCELVNATSEEEFYYSDSHLPVEEGDPVGVDLG